LPFSGLFAVFGRFLPRKAFWTQNGQDTCLEKLKKNCCWAGLNVCLLYLLLMSNLSASHAVKIRRSRPRSARLDLDSISGAGDYNPTTTDKQKKFANQTISSWFKLILLDFQITSDKFLIKNKYSNFPVKSLNWEKMLKLRQYAKYRKFYRNFGYIK
jgi:hypothetical protein